MDLSFFCEVWLFLKTHDNTMYEIGQTIAPIIGIPLILRQLGSIDKSLRHDAYSRQIDYISTINEMQVNRPEISDVLYSRNSSFMRLSKEEKSAYHFTYLELAISERMNQMYEEELIDKPTWEAWCNFMTKQLLDRRMFYLVWRDEERYFHSDFARFLNNQPDFDWRKMHRR